MDFQKILLELLINQYNESNQGSTPSTQQTTVSSTQQPIVQPTQQPIVQPTQQPIVQPIQQPIVQPTQQPIVQPVQQPIVQPVQQPIVQTTETTQPTTPVEEWKFTKDMYDSLNNTLVNLTNVIQTNNRNNTAGTEKQEEFFI